MAEVVVTVNSRKYRVACAPGDEGRIQDLAQYFQAKVDALGLAPNSASEAQVLVLAGLLVADELSDQADAFETLIAERDRLQSELSRLHAELSSKVQSIENRTAQGVERAAHRLEQIVVRFEPTPA